MKLEFEDLSFNDLGNYIRIRLYRQFYFDIPKELVIKRLGDFKIKTNSIEIKDSAEKRFNFLMLEYMKELKNSLNGRRAVYIHKNSGIPLIGNISFGIVDRGSSLIEVKPITSCVLNCIYCSVNEGKNNKYTDFVVEEDYLFEEIKKLLEFKNSKNIEVHINAQGEPLLYPKLTRLISKISSLEYVSDISIDTNGVLLTKEKVDELLKAGLTRFNISLNAMDKEIARALSGTKAYNVERVIKICRYIQSVSNALLLAPILIDGFNNKEIPKIIKFGKEINARIGVQNFLEYKHGRNPAKEIPWDKFFELLDKYEKQFNVKLKLSPEDFKIEKTKELPKPFKVGDVVKAVILCPGRMPNEVIAAAKNRNITVITKKKSGSVRFKIIRTKHNIFLGKEV